MKLILIRHGATASNELHRYVGKHLDEPLSEAGRRQCEAAGVLAEVETVYVSPMRRARETAQICFPNAQLIPIEGLQEYDFGDFEGKSAADMAEDVAYRAWVESNCTTACPHGESRAEYMARSNTALACVLRDATQHDEDQVIVVAHGGTIMAAIHAWGVDEHNQPISKSDIDYFNWQVGPAQGYTMHARVQDPSITLHVCSRISTL